MTLESSEEEGIFFDDSQSARSDVGEKLSPAEEEKSDRHGLQNPAEMRADIGSEARMGEMLTRVSRRPTQARAKAIKRGRLHCP